MTEMPVHHLPLLTNLLVLTITLRGPAMPAQTTLHPRPRVVVGDTYIMGWSYYQPIREQHLPPQSQPLPLQ